MLKADPEGPGPLVSQYKAPLEAAGLIRGGPLVAGVEVSAIVSESHSLSATATSLSLESGSQVSDHIIVNPDEVTVAFAVTNAGHGPDAARDVFESFRKILLERELVELVTEHHVYENMAVISVSPVHQAPFKGALSFTVRLRQVNFVVLHSSGREPAVLEKGPTRKTASGPANGGQQEAAEPGQSEERAIKRRNDTVAAGEQKAATAGNTDSGQPDTKE